MHETAWFSYNPETPVANLWSNLKITMKIFSLLRRFIIKIQNIRNNILYSFHKTTMFS
jgi:hypothetical protein